jgi:hypothetical protein
MVGGFSLPYRYLAVYTLWGSGSHTHPQILVKEKKNDSNELKRN